MNEAFVYIIYSESIDRFYIGVTKESVENRLQKHNHSSYGNHFTSQAKDWMSKLDIQCKDFSQARKIELHIKHMKSRKYIQSLIENKIEVKNLLQKY